MGSEGFCPRGTQLFFPLATGGGCISQSLHVFYPFVRGKNNEIQAEVLRLLAQHMAHGKCSIHVCDMNEFKGRREQKEGNNLPPTCFFFCRCSHLSDQHRHRQQWLLKGLIHYVVNWLLFYNSCSFQLSVPRKLDTKAAASSHP